MPTLPWRHPYTCLLSGPTSCGKSMFVAKFLKHLGQMSVTNFERIFLYYGEWQSGYRELGKNVEFREGLPQSSDWAGDTRAKLIIVDDLMSEVSSSGGGVIANLFTTGSHHNNLSVMYIVQNIFHQNKWQRDILLNFHYIVIFRNFVHRPNTFRDKFALKIPIFARSVSRRHLATIWVSAFGS